MKRLITLAGLLVLVSGALVAATAIPAQAQDTVATVGLVDPASGVWRLRAANGSTTSFYYGVPGDFPFVGDWDCDGVDTPGLYRQSDGYVYLRNSNTQGVADLRYFFGIPGDIPLAGDFDGDGCDTVSLYRPSEGRVYIINRLGSEDRGLGAADFAYYFGIPGDEPFTGDFDADGVDEVGLHRRSTGLVYLRLTHTQGVADVDFIYGDPGDVVMAADWTGDGTGTVGLYRPSESRFYLRHRNSTGIADESFTWGDPAWLPVAGEFALDLPPPEPSLSLRPVVSGLSSPLFVTAPAGDLRLFVVEQGGRIRVVRSGQVLAAPFLSLPVLSGGERGLLGMAFHPDYGSNGKFYVHYSTAAGVPTGFDHNSVVAEFTVSADPNVADATSERRLLVIPQPSSNHNGGMLAFGPDGYLYVGLGDGGGAGCTEPCSSRDPNTFLGSLLRIDVDGRDPGKEYRVPTDNPFVSGGGAPEVWAYGLRNPWRFSFDAGLLYIGDVVGQDAREEIDVVSASLPGADYGWDIFEGTRCFDAAKGCTPAGQIAPVLEYTHAQGCSVTGGYVYRGQEIPHLVGDYVYGDWCGGWVKSFRYDGGSVSDATDWTADLGTVSRLTSFGVDGFGEIYVVSGRGSVYRIAAG